MHLKIKSTGFIVETKDEGPIHEFFEQMVHLLHCETFETSKKKALLIKITQLQREIKVRQNIF